MLAGVEEPRLTKENLGAAVRHLRRARGLTIEELACASKTDVGYLTEIELGKRNPTFDKLVLIASGLEMNFVELAAAVFEKAARGESA
jgi:transcriptional regulator with XRE-family HTH domain